MQNDEKPGPWQRISARSRSIGIDPVFLPVIAGIAVLFAVSAITGKTVLGTEPEPAASPTPPSKVAEPSPPDYWLKNRAEREIKKLLKDPDSAEFTDLTVQRSPALVVCGYVNSRNGFGGMTGRQEFMSGTITVLREQIDDAAFVKTWQKLC